MKRLMLLFLSIVYIATACTPKQAIEDKGNPTLPKSTLEPSTPTPLLLTSPTKLEESTRERIEFGPDINIVTRSGELANNESMEYVFSALASQNLYIQTAGFGNPVSFTMRGPNDEIWSGEQQAGEHQNFTAQVTIPQSGDYVLSLSTPSGTETTRYEVVFTILSSSLPTITAPKETPEQVELAAKGLPVERISLLPSGLAVKQYVLAGKENQMITVELTSDNVPITLIITSPSGIQYFIEVFPADAGFRASYTFTLAETGEYIVTLTKAEKTPSTNYAASFMIK